MLPMHLTPWAKPDVVKFAAAYGFALAKIYPLYYFDKHIVLIAMRLFLKLNGHNLPVSPEKKYKTIIRVTARDVSEGRLAQWIRKNVE